MCVVFICILYINLKIQSTKTIKLIPILCKNGSDENFLFKIMLFGFLLTINSLIAKHEYPGRQWSDGGGFKAFLLFIYAIQQLGI